MKKQLYTASLKYLNGTIKIHSLNHFQTLVVTSSTFHINCDLRSTIEICLHPGGNQMTFYPPYRSPVAFPMT